VGVTQHGIDEILSGANLDVFLDALSLHHKQQLIAGLG
jgi:protein subunit release factor A